MFFKRGHILDKMPSTIRFIVPWLSSIENIAVFHVLSPVNFSKLVSNQILWGSLLNDGCDSAKISGV